MSIRLTTALLAALTCTSAWAKGEPPKLNLDTVNKAAFAPLPDRSTRKPIPEVLRAEVLLDRARFSPGAMDGIDGDNFRKALGAYQATFGLPVTSRLDQATWDLLTKNDPGDALVKRTLTGDDVKGPFAKRIPKKMEEQAKVGPMRYRNPVEKLSEETHASQGLLHALNPRVHFDKEGQDLVVPQVVANRPTTPVTRIVVDKQGHDVQAYGADGNLVAFYPASIGSTEKPAPSGDFKIVRITHNPSYKYNPKYKFKGVETKAPFTIEKGPNNPVGSVWMALSDEGYGIHGTPEPDLIGKTQSHGCIRLTNWDVEDLAGVASSGIPVSFPDEAPQLQARHDSAPQTNPPQIATPGTMPAATQAIPSASSVPSDAQGVPGSVSGPAASTPAPTTPAALPLTPSKG